MSEFVLRLVRTGIAWLYTMVMAFIACCLIFRPRFMWVTIAPRWARGTMWLGGIHLDVAGREHLRGPAVFVSNHQSLIEAVFLPALLPPTVKFVAKKELERIPLWGWGFAAGGAIMIDRNDPKGAVHSIREGVRQLPRGWSVAVFPEGTRSIDGRLQAFKKGAFHIAMAAHLPLVPIGIAGARDIMVKHGRLLRPGTAYMTVGAPIPTDTWTAETLNQHIAEVRETVARCIETSDRRRAEALAKLESELRLSVGA
jgi:1-acyl-sn-glycerol-3-phosphate acyltransferase